MALYKVGILVQTAAKGAVGGMRRLGTAMRTVTNGLRNVTGRAVAMGLGFRTGQRGVGGFAEGLFNLRGVVGGFLAYLGGQTLYERLLGSNAKLEQAQLGIAAMIRANVKLRDSSGRVLEGQDAWNASMAISNRLTERFRQMAIDSPIGSSRDFQNTFRGILTYALQAGATLERTQDLSLKTVTTAKLLNVPLEIAARDINQLLSGTASVAELSLLPAFNSLGMTMAEFNKLTRPQRLAAIERMLGNFAQPEAIKAYAGSWQGLIDTVGEYADLVMTTLGGPIFRYLQGFLQEGVKWLSDNREAVTAWASAFGRDLVGALKNVISFGRDVYGFFKGWLEPVFQNRAATIALIGGLTLLVAALNPVGTVIGLVSTGLVLMATNWERVKKAASNVPQLIANVTDRVWISVKNLELSLTKRMRDNPILNFLFGGQLARNEVGLRLDIREAQSRIAGRDAGSVAAGAAASVPPGVPVGPFVPQVTVPGLPTAYAAGGGSAVPLSASPNVSVQVSQTVQTPNPQRAAQLANQGVGRAVWAGADAARLGPPLTEQRR